MGPGSRYQAPTPLAVPRRAARLDIRPAAGIARGPESTGHGNLTADPGRAASLPGAFLVRGSSHHRDCGWCIWWSACLWGSTATVIILACLRAYTRFGSGAF
jgi:hypothetical protein